MKKVVLFIGLFGICLTTGACLSAQDSSVSTQQARACGRRTATVSQLPAELARIHGCRARACGGWLQNPETRELAGLTVGNWLWIGPASKVFSIAEQDALMTEAQARAQASLPASKTITGIAYFTEIAVPVTETEYFLGASASYANCASVVRPR